VYDDVNFGGDAATFRSDIPDLRNVRMNDRISSLRVAPGERWEVCEDTFYHGRCIIVSGSEIDLRARGLNDAITSLRRVESRGYNRRDDRDDREVHGDRDVRGAAGLRAWDDVNFGGEAAVFSGDVADLREFRFNDRISSLQVPPGESWEVCEDTYFNGRCIVVSGSEPDLRRRGLNDAITSLRRVSDGRRDGFYPPPPQARGAIVLFDRPGYRGTAQRVQEPAPGLGQFSYQAQSAQVLDGEWELCEEPRWGGRCVRINSSVPELQRLGLRGVASVRPLDRGR
jgi:beta/gamma crystallin